jgi:hypothetical protein
MSGVSIPHYDFCFVVRSVGYTSHHSDIATQKDVTFVMVPIQKVITYANGYAFAVL